MKYAAARFYNGKKMVEKRRFYVSNDETLAYRTLIEAREYGEKMGYEEYRIWGETYRIHGGEK